MSAENQSVEEKIIQAGIECIDRFGIEGVTIRRIAEIAGVNSAATNYYFRSKDVLIQKCLERTLENAFNWDQYNDLPESPAQDRVAAIMMDLLRGSNDYPGITRFHLLDIIEGGGKTLTMQRMSEFLVALADDIKGRNLPLEDEELHFAIAQILSSIMMVSSSPTMFQKSFGMDLRDDETRQRFVHRLVNRLL